jgi:UDP-2,3-diacylglucosamine hydrolase
VPAKVGILAGTGPLPRCLVDACRAQDRGVFVITFEGDNLNREIGDAPQECVHLGKVGTILRRLKEEGCEEVTMAGHFQRPAYSQLKLDLKAARLIPKLIRAKGDDALLRVLAGTLEQEGLKVVGADTLLPGLQIGPGAFGTAAPSAEHQIDITTARELLRILGRYDVGQAVIVRRKRVLGIEGPEGTDNLIDRCADVDGETGGVLVKMRKPGQDNRVDLPSIGLETVRRCVAANLSGIAVEAHAALVMDQDALRQKADAHGFFVTAFVEGQPPETP